MEKIRKKDLKIYSMQFAFYMQLHNESIANAIWQRVRLAHFVWMAHRRSWISAFNRIAKSKSSVTVQHCVQYVTARTCMFDAIIIENYMFRMGMTTFSMH